MTRLPIAVAAARFLVAAAVVWTTAPSQSCFYNETSDPLTPATSATSPQPLGFSGNSLRGNLAQVLIPRFQFQNAPVSITGLAFSPATSGQLTYARLCIRMALTSRETLSSVFADNPDTPLVTVLDAHDYVWPCAEGTWNEIGLQDPFLYTPTAGNLLIEVQTEDISFTNSFFDPYFHQGGAAHLMISLGYTAAPGPNGSFQTRVPRMRVCADRADLRWLGQGCDGSAGTAPGLGFQGSARLGNTVGTVLSNARSAELAILAFGFDSRPPFPLALDGMGMPGCRRYFAVANSNAYITDANGMAVDLLAIPNQSSLVGLVLYAQFFVHDAAANAAGAVASNYGRIQPGL